MLLIGFKDDPLPSSCLASLVCVQIIVTHDQEEAFDLADKVVIFNRGLIEQVGPTHTLSHCVTSHLISQTADMGCSI